MEHLGLWGIIPPLLTIVLALVTKDVILSLFAGILSGTLIVASGNPFIALTSLSDLLAGMVGDGWNIRILLFCALMGGFVGMFSRTGATKAFGVWASRFLRTKRSVMLFTWFFGLLIFIDDYFNALAVGTVMRPATDEHKVSRAKLAYILDSTAAPICIIAPISTWVVTVISYIRDTETFKATGLNEFVFFLQLIPYNLYALLAIIFVFLLAMGLKDFGPMARSEKNASNGMLFDSERFGECPGDLGRADEDRGACWFDMIISLLILIIVSTIMFPVTTWLGAVGSEGIVTFADAVASISLFDAFVSTDASKALFYGAIISIVISYIYYLSRRLLTIRGASDAITDGIKSMVPALMVLSLAWTIGGVIRATPENGGLGLALFLSDVVGSSNLPLWILPVVLYLIACLIAFSTGTSWGTFGIMIPLALPIAEALAISNGYTGTDMITILSISLGAVLSGGIFGDHCSPISDTTILSSTGSNCPLLEHVITQMPYAVVIGLSSLVGIVVGSLTFNPFMAFATGLITLLVLSKLAPRILKAE